MVKVPEKGICASKRKVLIALNQGAKGSIPCLRTGLSITGRHH